VSRRHQLDTTGAMGSVGGARFVEPADVSANHQVALTTAALYLLMSVPLGYPSRYLEKRWGTKG
jgi:hypothetical protein